MIVGLAYASWLRKGSSTLGAGLTTLQRAKRPSELDSADADIDRPAPNRFSRWIGSNSAAFPSDQRRGPCPGKTCPGAHHVSDVLVTEQ